MNLDASFRSQRATGGLGWLGKRLDAILRAAHPVCLRFGKPSACTDRPSPASAPGPKCPTHEHEPNRCTPQARQNGVMNRNVV